MLYSVACFERKINNSLNELSKRMKNAVNRFPPSHSPHPSKWSFGKVNISVFSICLSCAVVSVQLHHTWLLQFFINSDSSSFVCSHPTIYSKAYLSTTDRRITLSLHSHNSQAQSRALLSSQKLAPTLAVKWEEAFITDSEWRVRLLSCFCNKKKMNYYNVRIGMLVQAPFLRKSNCSRGCDKEHKEDEPSSSCDKECQRRPEGLLWRLHDCVMNMKIKEEKNTLMLMLNRKPGDDLVALLNIIFA